MQTLKVKEVAEYLKLNPETVLRMIRRGDLQAIRIGRTWRITAEEIQKFIENGGIKNGNSSN